MKIEQIIKIAKMKETALLGKNAISRVKEICGTCDSMGIHVEGKRAKNIMGAIDNGNFDDKLQE